MCSHKLCLGRTLYTAWHRPNCITFSTWPFSVGPFVCHQTCEHCILKTNKPQSMQIGTSGSRGKNTKWLTLWIRISKINVTEFILDPVGSSRFSICDVFRPHMTLIFDLLTPKVDHFMPLPMDHLWQLASKSVYLFSQYRLYKFDTHMNERRRNERTDERTDGRTTREEHNASAGQSVPADVITSALKEFKSSPRSMLYFTMSNLLDGRI